MNNFYITLLSKSNNDYLKNNPSNFKIKLAQNIKLNANWQVGIAELSYQRSWYNINKEENIEIKYFDKKLKTKNFILKPGYYSIEDLIASINRLFRLEESNSTVKLPKLRIIVKKSSENLEIEFAIHKNMLVFPVFSENLNQILGINKESFDNMSDTILLGYGTQAALAKKLSGNIDNDEYDYIPMSEPNGNVYLSQDNVNISGGLNTLYCYCDLVLPSYVGDSLTQLLKVIEIPSDSDFRDQIHIIYSNIQYFPLLTKEFDCIEIDIKDDTGEHIKFNRGLTVVKLHFRKNNKRN